MKRFGLFLILFTMAAPAFCQSKLNEGALQISMPVTRIVYQRDVNNKAVVPVRGTVPTGVSTVEARLVARAAGQGKTTKWRRITAAADGTFSGTLKGRGGWYNLEVRADNENKITAIVERVGIGDVFVIVGHSVAQGGDINIEGAGDDRVNTVAVHEHTDMNEQYLKTGNPDFLPRPQFVQAASGVAPAPFGHNSYFWAKFGELVVQNENVPVLIYNAGFGGTNLVHWARASQGMQFEHGFVKSSIRMPYINLYNTFKKYIPLTGLRAILADHGQNDNGEKNSDTIFHNYQVFARQARADLGYEKLAIVVNRQTPHNGNKSVRAAQERMAKEPYCFAGPDYDVLLKDDRTDGIHLSESGLRKAAVLWANALTPRFFKRAKPWLPGW